MIKGIIRRADGEVALMLGLSEHNIVRLRQGDPIYFETEAIKMQPSDHLMSVTVFYGKDDHELTDQIRELFGSKTEVIVVPRGDGKPQ